MTLAIFSIQSHSDSSFFCQEDPPKWPDFFVGGNRRNICESYPVVIFLDFMWKKRNRRTFGNVEQSAQSYCSIIEELLCKSLLLWVRMGIAERLVLLIGFVDWVGSRQEREDFFIFPLFQATHFDFCVYRTQVPWCVALFVIIYLVIACLPKKQSDSILCNGLNEICSKSF